MNLENRQIGILKGLKDFMHLKYENKSPKPPTHPLFWETAPCVFIETRTSRNECGLWALRRDRWRSGSEELRPGRRSKHKSGHSGKILRPSCLFVFWEGNHNRTKNKKGKATSFSFEWSYGRNLAIQPPPTPRGEGDRRPPPFPRAAAWARL